MRNNYMAGALSKVQGRDWIQEAYETGDPKIRQRTSTLKRLGYRAKLFPMGNQVTQWGLVKLTMVDSRAGSSGDPYLERVQVANPAKRLNGRAKKGNPGLYDSIKPGSRVSIVNRFGQVSSGRAVMRGPAGWVLNMGGRHGTPDIASPKNVVKVSGGGTRAEFIRAGNPRVSTPKTWARQRAEGEKRWQVSIHHAKVPTRVFDTLAEAKALVARVKRGRTYQGVHYDIFDRETGDFKESGVIGDEGRTVRKNPLPVGRLVTVRARRLKNGRVELYRA